MDLLVLHFKINVSTQELILPIPKGKHKVFCNEMSFVGMKKAGVNPTYHNHKRMVKQAFVPSSINIL